MAKYKPGQSGNPKGGKKLDPMVKGATHLNNATVTLAIHKYYDLPREKLAELLKDPSTAAGDAMIISVMLHAIKTGDYKRLDSLLDRACGRVKQVVEHQGSQTLKIEEERRKAAFVAMLTSNEQAAAALEVLIKTEEETREQE